MNIKILGTEVENGRNHLIDGNGEVIRPDVWDRVIQPDMSITMHILPLRRSLRPLQLPSTTRFPPPNIRAPPPEPQSQDKGGVKSSSNMAKSSRGEGRDRRRPNLKGERRLKHQNPKIRKGP